MAHNLRREELADMHMVYGATPGNAIEESVTLYQERIPNKCPLPYISSLA